MNFYKQFAEGYALPIQPINTNSEQYKHLRPYLEQEDKTLVVSQRPVPSSECIRLSEDLYIGFGSFYGIGELSKWLNTWEELDARIVIPITNEQIIDYLEKELHRAESITLEEALEEVDNDINQLCEMFKLPYVC